MANKTVYPFGTEGRLPSSIGLINDLRTGGADMALAAEQGKVLDDIIFQMNAYDIYRLDQTEHAGWFINSSNLWSHNTTTPNNYGCILIPITPGKRYTVYGDTAIALLKSDSRVSGEAPDFCDNYEGRIVVSAGSLYSFIAPADANYLYFLTKSGGNEKSGSVKYSDADFGAAIRKNTEAIVQFNSKKIDTSSLTPLAGWIISSNGKWNKSTPTEDYSSLLVPVTPGKEYTLIGNTTGSIFAVLKSATKSNGGTPDFSESYPSRIRVKRYEHFSFTAPSDAAYVYLHTKSSGNEYDSYVAVPEPLYEQLAGVGDDGDVAKVKDGFDTAPEYYAWLKMEQATKIKWTPLKNTIQKPSSTGKFATTEQTGFPYSSAAEYDKRLGADVSIHTFMTAIHNPYSVMYTECIRGGGYSKSAYGIIYYGADNAGPYYGMVCSGLADYALGGEVPWLTNDLYIDLVTEFGLCEVIFDQSANGMKRGDILCTSGHTRIVKDVWRKNGVVTDVRISEAVQPLVIDNAVKSAENFNSYLKTNGIVAVRYKELYKNIHYEPSPYVAVGDETPQAVVYNDDICCFAGDKAAFLEGDLIYIHCLNLDYPQMELYKDDVLVETITLDSDARAAKTSDDLAYAVNLSNDNLGYGMYKARLKNGNDYSDYTYFEVINASVTYADGVATYNSANATAVCWYWQRYHDSQGAKIYDVTPLDGQQSGTIEMTPPGSTWPLLKVLFKGEYGRVAARFLNQ